MIPTHSIEVWWKCTHVKSVDEKTGEVATAVLTALAGIVEM